jgi:hypothetical protein
MSLLGNDLQRSTCHSCVGPEARPRDKQSGVSTFFMLRSHIRIVGITLDWAIERHDHDHLNDASQHRLSAVWQPDVWARRRSWP